MAKNKAPFFIIEDFLSPKLCEIIIDDLGYVEPDTDAEGNPLKMERWIGEEYQKLLHEQYIENIIPSLENYYGFQHRATELTYLQYLPEGAMEPPHCDNSTFSKETKKWIRNRDRDFTITIFLTDYNDNPPFDTEYEVYGGKYEFPQHNFGFNPIRGTLIIHPSDPHFINNTSQVLVGNHYVLKSYLAASVPYLYNPKNFPGNYTTWFDV